MAQHRDYKQVNFVHIPKINRAPISFIKQKPRTDCYKDLFYDSISLMKKLFVPLILFLIPVLFSQASEINLSWRAATGGKIRARPVILDRGSVCIISEDHHVYSYDATGNMEWKYRIQEKVSDSFKKGPSGLLYAVSETGRLYGLNEYGTLIFENRIVDGTPWGQLVFHHTGPLAGITHEGVVYSASHNGLRRWSIDMKSKPAAQPVMTDSGNVFTAHKNNSIRILSLYGEERGELSFSSRITALVNGPGDTVLAGFSDGRFRTISPGGTVLRETTQQFGSVSAMYPAESGLVLLCGTNTIAIFDYDGNRAQAAFDTAVPVNPQITAGPGSSFFAVGTDGRVICFDMRGRIIWSFSGKNRMNLPVISDEGTIYVGSRDWVFYVFSSIPTVWEARKPNVALQKNVTRQKVFTDPDYRYLYGLLTSGDEDIFHEAMAMIHKDINSENVGIRELHFRIMCQELSKQWLNHESRPSYGPHYISDSIRAEVVSILGRVGDLHTIRLLTELLFQEKKSLVRARIISTLGEIGSDPRGTVCEAMYRLALSLRYDKTNKRIASAIINCLIRLHTYNSGFTSPDGIKAFEALYKLNIPAEEKEHILNYLKTMNY